METNEFTKISSNWMNTFLRDLANNKDKIMRSVDSFPGNREIVKIGILEGPEKLGDSIDAAKEMFNFISYYATGRIQEVEIKAKDEK